MSHSFDQLAPILSSKNLTLQYDSNKIFNIFKKNSPAVRDASFEIFPGEIVGIVGESGSGKSTLMKAICKLIPIKAGTLTIDGTDVTNFSNRKFLPYRKKIQIISQDFSETFNPHMNVFQILSEPLDIHFKYLSRNEKDWKIKTLLTNVGLSHELISRFPNELSGGQRQRLSIARGLAVDPELLICDEIVSACDVCTQKQILDLLLLLNKTKNISILFISHNIAVIAYLCQKIIVMKDGRIVETGDTKSVCNNPQTEYCKLLMSAVPVLTL